MFALPQILILGDVIIEKTSFTLKKRERAVYRNSKVTVSGLVRGYVNGRIEGIVTGVIIGDLDAKIESKSHFEARSLDDVQYIESNITEALPGEIANVPETHDPVQDTDSGNDNVSNVNTGRKPAKPTRPPKRKNRDGKKGSKEGEI